MTSKEKHPLWDIMVVAMLGISIPWWSYVFTIVWSWFIVPLGVVPIGMAHAFGINMVFKAIFQSSAKNKNDGWTEEERDAYNIGVAYLGPLITLAFSYIAHRFM